MALGLKFSVARQRAKVLAMAVLTVTLLTVTLIALPSSAASASAAATRSVASSTLTSNGQWPGVGKICEAGAGGASSVRGVGPKSIHIAVFNDESNTALPGLEKEFLNSATLLPLGVTRRVASTDDTS